MTFNELGKIKIGTKLRINKLDGTVIGAIEYRNPADNKCWTEYRITTKRGERWLSIDTAYKEYSISWPANNVKGKISPKWHKVDEGTQIVRKYRGNVDVDAGERAEFVEFEDETEEKILSVETWSDGTEYSMGEYLDLNEITITGYEKPKSAGSAGAMVYAILFYIAVSLGCWLFGFIIQAIFDGINGPIKISNYLKGSSSYSYVTSITGNEGQKADVYKYASRGTTDEVAYNIIKGVEGNTEKITQEDDESGKTIAIVTKKEYCLIYHPEEYEAYVYVQISPRKYNYTSDNAPYRGSSSTTRWYRSHYYSTAYSKDASSFGKTPSAYTFYKGDTIHNIGNGYFDSYSSSVRQSSVNRRNSSSGGLGGGK